MQLSGRTDVLPLFDVVQMLSVNEATGMLRVETKAEKGYLYLQGGAVINALDYDHREGEEAAKRVFAMEDAEFSFTPELPSVAERIHSTTQTLMMDVARQLDEERIGEGGTPSHGERVRGVQAASEALRDIFAQLDQDSRIHSLRSHQGTSLAQLIEGLSAHTGGVLFLGEGSPPAVRVNDRLAPISEIAVDRRGYEELRDLLLRDAVPLGAPAGEPEAFLVSAGTLGPLRVEPVRWDGGELLTVRAVPGEPELAEALPWPTEILDEHLAAAGSVVVLTVPDRPELARIFAAACAPFLAREMGPVVGFARRWSPALPRAGVVLLSTLRLAGPATGPSLVDRLDPALVAVEDADCAPALAAALHALRGGGRALIGVCAPEPRDAVDRLLGALDPVDLRAWMRQLGSGLRAVLSPDGGIREIDPPVRAALLAGDADPLATALR